MSMKRLVAFAVLVLGFAVIAGCASADWRSTAAAATAFDDPFYSSKYSP